MEQIIDLMSKDEILQKLSKPSEYFMKQQLEKRKQFHERVHAAFILNTSLNTFGKLTDDNLSWLFSAYPHSEVKIGNDQGANYYSIRPNF